MKIAGVVLLVGVALLCLSCAMPAREAPLLARDEATSSVHVVSHGWHTGIALKRNEIPTNLLPERRDFPAVEYLEFGWGDRDFYQAREFSLALAMQAALSSKASVLHVVGFNDGVTRRFPGSEIIELPLSAERLAALSLYVHQSVARDGDLPASPLGVGLYANSRFYPASGTFSLSNTCNTWTARALQAAGYSVSPSATAGPLMSQLNALARSLRSAEEISH